jgi:mono/diheme cytochrome c family protein
MTEWRTMSANGILPLYQKVFFLFSASLAGLLLNAQTVNFHNAPDSTKSMKNPLEGQPPANGQHADHLRCARCHAEQGEGSGNIPPLKEDKIKATTPGELFWFITQGDEKNGMPSWAQLSRQERWLIVNYVKAIGTPMDAGAAAETSEPAGWFWWYMGGHQDPRHPGKHPELKDKVITPDVILHPHTASLELTFYNGNQFQWHIKTISLPPSMARGINQSALATK